MDDTSRIIRAYLLALGAAGVPKEALKYIGLGTRKTKSKRLIKGINNVAVRCKCGNTANNSVYLNPNIWLFPRDSWTSAIHVIQKKPPKKHTNIIFDDVRQNSRVL